MLSTECIRELEDLLAIVTQRLWNLKQLSWHVDAPRRSCLPGRRLMAGTRESVVDRLVVQAIAGGAKTLRIEYDEGYEEGSGCQGDVGVSIGCRIPSSSEDAKSLRA